MCIFEKINVENVKREARGEFLENKRLDIALKKALKKFTSIFFFEINRELRNLIPFF